MKIAVVGSGYVGLVTAACFAEYGNTVIGVDIDEVKVSHLQRGIIPIYEPGLDTLIRECAEKGQISFTTDTAAAVRASDYIFIAVGTPQDEDGSADIHYVTDVAHAIGRAMYDHKYIVVKSTVPVGTSKLVRQAIQEELDQRKCKLSFDVISNPEFLKEGTALSDCRRPDRVVIGTDNLDAERAMRELYRHFVLSDAHFVCIDIPSAEMTKYTANAMLAAKISFMNEISSICERVGADVNKVRIGIGSDPRIGYKFIYPGCGYGGSCFPKDVRALINTSREHGYEPSILRSIDEVNEAQKRVIVNKIVDRFGNDLRGMTFALWGLAFKPNTDDMRAAPVLTIVEELTAMGARFRAYDPKAMNEAKDRYFKDLDNIAYCQSKYDALEGADALILLTEWKEFRSPDFDEIMARLHTACIFDGRNQYDKEYLFDAGFEYYQIGVSTNEANLSHGRRRVHRKQSVRALGE